MTGQAIIGQVLGERLTDALAAGSPAVLDPEWLAVHRIPSDGGLTITMNATRPSQDHRTAEAPPETVYRFGALGTIERAG
ncbi:hypothetical protein O159_24020 [Leifsonia xyli subsp. cynodontis DSM 46306]|uniref:Uncharacterized protein n=1 Tax=Leifsonia xyli subsp. cynodontis DSM 46306 TaxID=1389489 RepID=U3PA38_LEIXC|nr:hypothetical protein [Leifsonia xyli]AGW42359.1 hypothetical protein O159_24020 [Leifsonia xyli subsp. cynodontis DSM 46306]